VLHDLRSPAQSLTLLADLVADPDTEVEAVLRESCGRLGRSLDLLSRVLHPSATAELGPISVRESLQFIRDLHHAGRTSARLEVAIDPSVQAAAGIQRHLEHALLNLVLHATGALQSRQGGIIRITARNNGDQVEIVVADNGPGMAPDALAGDPLLVASEVLRLSGGTLAYADASAPDAEAGARFVITLPQWRRAAPREQ
jgi:C4-dicarboxylate-specific signal transduction histidine kinase